MDFTLLHQKLDLIMVETQDLIEALETLPTVNSIITDFEDQMLIFAREALVLLMHAESVATRAQLAKSVLEQFLTIDHASDDVRSKLEVYKEEAESLLENPEDVYDTDLAPFALFVDLVAKHNREISEDEEDLIYDSFDRSLVRVLFQGLLTMAITEELELPKDDDSSPALDKGSSEPPQKDEQALAFEAMEKARIEAERQAQVEAALAEQTRLMAQIHERFSVVRAVEAEFGVKAFLNRFTREKGPRSIPGMKTNSTLITVSSMINSTNAKSGDLSVLERLANAGAVSEAQFALEVSTPGSIVSNQILESLLNIGYIMQFQDKETGLNYYALSKMGREIFKRPKTRDAIKDQISIHEDIQYYDTAIKDLFLHSAAYDKAAAVAFFVARYFKAQDPISFDLARTYLHNCDSALWISVQHTKQKSLKQFLLIWSSPDGRICVSTSDLAEGTLSRKDRMALCTSLLQEPEYTASVDDPSAVTLHREDGSTVSLEELFSRFFEFLQPITREETHQEAQESPMVVAKEEDTTITEEETPVVDEVAEEITLVPKAYPFQPLAQAILDKGTFPESSDDIQAILQSLLNEAINQYAGFNCYDFLGRALVLLKSASQQNPEDYASDYERLLLATDIPIEHRVYSGMKVAELFSGEHQGTAIHLAALLRALLAPSEPHDFLLYEHAQSAKEQFEQLFPEFSALKPLLDTFTEIRQVLPSGFSARETSRFANVETREAQLISVTARAKSLRPLPYIYIPISGGAEFLSLCFGQNSEIGECLKLISEGNIAERNFIAGVYEGFCDKGVVTVERISDVLDARWRGFRRTHKRTDNEIIGVPKTRISRAFEERLRLIEEWLVLTEAPERSKNNALVKLHAQVTEELSKATEALSEATNLPNADLSILRHALYSLNLRLAGDTAPYFMPDDWLSTGVLAIENGIPLVDDRFVGMRYLEPWRVSLTHIALTPDPLATTLDNIADSTHTLFDNLGLAIQICQYLDNSAKGKLYQDSIPVARAAAEEVLVAFINELTIDYAYGRIDETMKDAIETHIETLKPIFWNSSNFAGFRAFLNALRREINDEIAVRREYWAQAVASRLQQNPSKALESSLAALESEKPNFNLVEDAVNSHDSGSGVDYSEPITEPNPFIEFIASPGFEMLYGLCNRNKGKAFRDFAPRFARETIERERLSTQYIRSAERLVESLPNSYYAGADSSIRILLEELGFHVTQVAQSSESSASVAMFLASVTPDKKNRALYDHPIAEMGTALSSELSVIELFGSMQPESIVAEVRKINPRRMPIVLLNGALSLPQRRQLASLFLKEGNAANPFILIDWVLLLHLATKLPEERMATMLACSLPYTGIKQLFSLNSSAPIADEMYIGRTKELAALMDMKGPVIVYGGRQLGKTALLMRAKNRFHAPDEGDYAVFVNAKDCISEEIFVRHIATELSEAGIDIPFPRSVAALCEGLRAWLRSNSKRLILFVDESDQILASMAKKNNYAALTHLEDVCRFAENRFKFVFAGLHNVFLAANDANTIFGHFGQPLCVKPLAWVDAYNLLARPLRYMGFDLSEDVVLRLLINTNFYPGVVHFIGSEILAMLTSSYATHYNSASHPPYVLTEKQLGAIMNSSNLINSIEERIRMTLHVDADYLNLARFVALLYYLDSDPQNHGFSIESIFECDASLGLNKLADMNREYCASLLSELCDMSILVEANGHYRFRQRRLLSIIGKNADEIISQLASSKEAN